MAFTEEQQHGWLSEQAYWVDKGKSDVKYHPVEGKTYNLNPDDKPLGQFKVLKVVDNTSNGMQTMAVASVDKNGNGTAIYAIL
ncbi:hypothetical protein D8895_10970 [Streptococcus sp. BCA20]|uniref:Uncharacterized protein n=1 Tax=Streptococcus intermedius TaxID=1338 RepID=A0AAD1C934_STRIT|nr:hypothetical protein [Streptococcus intermedius]RSJ20457.1 hypothetical protein D8829_04835 [Streptococcus intermedius]RSJ28125.1 hypothetical protein D8895_10970 [Streptococcus sp. BCA20]BAW17349.1 hypothetical protein SITYG_13700 [Streptococcus intermedius]